MFKCNLCLIYSALACVPSKVTSTMKFNMWVVYSGIWSQEAKMEEYEDLAEEEGERIKDEISCWPLQEETDCSISFWEAQGTKVYVSLVKGLGCTLWAVLSDMSHTETTVSEKQAAHGVHGTWWGIVGWHQWKTNWSLKAGDNEEIESSAKEVTDKYRNIFSLNYMNYMYQTEKCLEGNSVAY